MESDVYQIFIVEDVDTKETVTTWINLLYATETYLTFEQAQTQFCKDSNVFCMAIFYELDFLGKLSFGIFCLAFVISLYDVVRLLRFGCN